MNLNLQRQETVQRIVEWLRGITEPAEGVLNVAGSRESKSPGIEQAVMVRMVDVISAVNGKLFYPINGNRE